MDGRKVVKKERLQKKEKEKKNLQQENMLYY